MADDTQPTPDAPATLSPATLDPTDGSWGSRKLWFSVGTSVAIMLGGVFYAFMPAFQSGFEIYCTALLACLSAFLGANVGNKMVVAKHIAMVTASKMQAAMGKNDNDQRP